MATPLERQGVRHGESSTGSGEQGVSRRDRGDHRGKAKAIVRHCLGAAAGRIRDPQIPPMQMGKRRSRCRRCAAGVFSRHVSGGLRRPAMRFRRCAAKRPDRASLSRVAAVALSRGCEPTVLDSKRDASRAAATLLVRASPPGALSSEQRRVTQRRTDLPLDIAPPMAILRRPPRTGCRKPARSASAEEPPARKTELTARQRPKSDQK